MTIAAVIFDIGNVLIRWQPEEFYDRLIGSERRAAMFSEVDLHHMNELIDRGDDFQSTVYDTADRYPSWRDEIVLWHDRWLDLAGPAIEHSVRLLRALRANGVPVHALSNIGEATLALAQSRHEFLSEFDMAFVSGALRVTKPSPEIYRIVEAETGIDPMGLLFADDREDNIAAAAARGWQTHHFADPEAFADRLVREGLLTADQAV